MADRSVRNLAHLESSASTARVLNLRSVHQQKKRDPEYSSAPLFEHPALNTSIIVKHRLRDNEADQFSTHRRIATKILIPIEVTDLRLGARYVFVGQRQFEQALYESFGIDIGAESRDLRTLNVLDSIPTLDPFLLREQLKRHGLAPARCYFELSEADARRMFAFAEREIEALVRMSIGEAAMASGLAGRLTKKILANSADADLEPLRRTMQLGEHQFQEGVFCWKAFLYYKWQLTDLLPRVSPVLQQIAAIKPVGPQTAEEQTYLDGARETLRKALIASCKAVKATLQIYDNAYRRLTEASDPIAFRDFLLKAPALFNALGERLGGIEHIVSFWRFRFPDADRLMIAPAELTSVFMDFESSLGGEQQVSRSMLPTPEIIEAA